MTVRNQSTKRTPRTPARVIRRTPKSMDAKDLSRLLTIALLESQRFHVLARDLATRVESPRAKTVAKLLIEGGTTRDLDLRKLVEDLRKSALSGS